MADDDSTSLGSLGSSSSNNRGAARAPAPKASRPPQDDSSSSLASSPASQPQADTPDDPSNKGASTGFRRYLMQKLGGGEETVQSFMMSRAWKKQEDTQWKTYLDLKRQGKLAPPAAPAKKAAPVVKKAVKPASDEVSSVLDSSDDEDAPAKPVAKAAPAKRKLDDSSDELSSSEDSDDAAAGGDSGAGYTDAQLDEYILEQKWVPDRESLHSFKSGRKYTTKYLPQIEAALKGRSAQAAAEPAAKKRKVEEAEEEGDAPMEEAADTTLLDEVILEMNPNLSAGDLDAYKTSRAFKKKQAEYEAAVAKRQENPDAVITSAAEPKKGSKGAAGVDAETAEEDSATRDERAKTAKEHAYGEKPGAASAVITVTNVPEAWYSADLESALTTQRSYRAQLETYKTAGTSREAANLAKKLKDFEKASAKVLAQATVPDRLRKAAGDEVAKGLTSFRCVTFNNCFTGVCILRYTDAAAAGRVFEHVRGRGTATQGSGSASWDECVAVDAGGDSALLFSLAHAAAPPPPKADGQIGTLLMAQAPDVAPPRKRKYDPAEKWWGSEFKKQQKPAAPEAEGTGAGEGVPTNEEIEARKRQEKEQEEAEKAAKQAENIKKAATFDEFVMAKMGLVQESFDSYINSRKFLKVKAQLEAEYEASK